MGAVWVLVSGGKYPSADPSRAASARSTAKQDSRDGAMADVVDQLCVCVMLTIGYRPDVSVIREK